MLARIAEAMQPGVAVRCYDEATQEGSMRVPGFGWLGEQSPLPVAARMIREHSSWLSRMLTGRRGTKQPPRIPVRRVSEGGFAGIMSSPAGRHRAERWWERTLERMKD